MSLENRNPSIIYIGGDGRSGSTLLDTILGSHPNIFGGGEIETLFGDLAENGTCSCGELYEECLYWKEIIRILYAKFPDLDPATVDYERVVVESTHGPYTVTPRRLAKIRERYGAVWSTLHQAISDVSQKPIIIDSSKSARGNSRRIHALRAYAGQDLKVLHLIRDPRAVLYSEWGRGHNDRLESNMHRQLIVGGMIRPLTGWVMANMAVSLTASLDKTLPLHRVHYEELATQPLLTLESIQQFIEFDLSPVIDMLRYDEPMNGGHGVHGNRMRRQGPIKMKVDTEWVRAMPHAARLCTKAIWPVARRYGYDVLNWPTAHTYLSTDFSTESKPPVTA